MVGLQALYQLLLYGKLRLHSLEEFLQFFDVGLVLLGNFGEHIGEVFGGSLEFGPDVDKNLNLKRN